MLLEVRCYVKPWSGWGALLGLRCFGHWLRLGGALLLWCGRGALLCATLVGVGGTAWVALLWALVEVGRSIAFVVREGRSL